MNEPLTDERPSSTLEDNVIILGLVLLILGLLVPAVHILVTIGIIVLIVGLVLLLMGSMGRAVGGRKHYF
jgi:uncharacterized membrane protein HdeD (DUF308 family)